jgi:hypothetical protein
MVPATTADKPEPVASKLDTALFKFCKIVETFWETTNPNPSVISALI